MAKTDGFSCPGLTSNMMNDYYLGNNHYFLSLLHPLVIISFSYLLIYSTHICHALTLYPHTLLTTEG